MSSLRNAVQRRNHRERAQPKLREKWGLLEKHKDYALRARDYNEKKSTLQTLRQKARDRNPDEFSYGMLSSRTSNGQKLGARHSTALKHQVVQLMKTQDTGYLHITLSKTRKEIARLEETLHIDHVTSDPNSRSIDQGNIKSNKIVFTSINRDIVDERGSAISRQGAPQKMQKDQASTMSASTSTDGKVQNQSQSAEGVVGHPISETSANSMRQTKLSDLRAREQALLEAALEIDLQKAKMSSNVGGTNKTGCRWRMRERKR